MAGLTHQLCGGGILLTITHRQQRDRSAAKLEEADTVHDAHVTVTVFRLCYAALRDSLLVSTAALAQAASGRALLVHAYTDLLPTPAAEDCCADRHCTSNMQPHSNPASALCTWFSPAC
jgi:hypothetical protein